MKPLTLPNFFRHSIKAAKKSIHPYYPIGAALLTKRRRLIISGYNQFKTHTLIHGPQTLHAELHALSRLPYSYRTSIDSFILTISRLTTSGYGLARPCDYCMEVIKQVGLKQIAYTTNDGWQEEQI